MKAVKILLLFTTALVVTDFAFAQTWTQNTNVLEHRNGVASSADGSKLTALVVEQRVRYGFRPKFGS